MTTSDAKPCGDNITVDRAGGRLSEIRCLPAQSLFLCIMEVESRCGCCCDENGHLGGGALEFITGPMPAWGRRSHLPRRVSKLRVAGCRCLIVTNSIDKRAAVRATWAKRKVKMQRVPRGRLRG
ncbi:hypothetical protein DQ04_00781080 [Trypanosoma grayi]|uniref:hypothetical protein n=1 Tax=Trypanosoma grayi TaxID=71804 RepID=UPI0004F47F85|nr:hypothetical protein DQ04_00781080 [Trypanosoma grayi]KEG13797.1 hypothetical protein DQ04_00781080 [Trypanosoma grayi]